MNVQEIIKRAGGQTALHRMTGIPLRTIQNWAAGNRQPPDYIEWLLTEWYNNRFELVGLRSDNESLKRSIRQLTYENKQLRETIATLCGR